MQMFLLLLCALVLAEGRSFPRSQRSYYDDHDDFYKELQRSWSAIPSNKNYRMGQPTTNYLVPEDSKYYIPLIDGKPIYIPEDHSKLRQPPTLIRKEVDSEVSTLNKIQTLQVPTAIRDKPSSSNANSKNRYEPLINGLTKQEENLRYGEKNVDIKPQCKNYKLSKNASGKSSLDDITCSNDQVKSMSETIHYKELDAAKDTVLKSEIKTEKNNRGDNSPSAATILNPMINESPSEFNNQVISMETEKPEAKIIKDAIIDNNLRDHNDDVGFLQQGSGLHEITKETEPERDTLSKASNPIETPSVETDQIANNKPNSGTSTEDTDMHDLVPIKLHESLKNDPLKSFSSSSRSLIFNPDALPRDKFQECETPKNETGTCRYVYHCLLPSIISSLDRFMDYVCIIQGRFIGVCCPELPVEKVVVEWKESSNFTHADEPVKTPKECGISSKTRIVGGLKSDPKEYPWMVALISEISKAFFCGGSLINDRYVLTAAHCTFGIQRNKIIARLGEYDFIDNTSTIHRNYKVAQIKRHGRYSRMTLRNDIALLKLEKPVQFNQFVGTICLPEDDEDFIDKTAVLAGWGNMEGGGPTSNVLMEASVKVISNKVCAASHRLPVPDSLICTGSENDTTGACNGDSGGPLMLLNEGEERWKMVGLVSWGRRGCNPDFPTVYTRVTHYLEWIRKHTER